MMPIPDHARRNGCRIGSSPELRGKTASLPGMKNACRAAMAACKPRFPAYGIAALCLVLLGPPAARAADWVTISSDYESTFFFDRDSLKRDGDVVEVRLLWNFPEMQLTRRPVKPYLSATRLTRYNCRAGSRADVETTLYRGAMAGGEVTEVYRTPDAEIRFEWVDPDAPGGESMRRVCAASTH
jgi:hypothetical protein